MKSLIRSLLVDLNSSLQDNVLVSDYGQPQICDFGISRIISASASLKSTTDVRGSTRWMAPEFCREGDPVTDHSKMTDVLSFGATIYVSLQFHTEYTSAD